MKSRPRTASVPARSGAARERRTHGQNWRAARIVTIWRSSAPGRPAWPRRCSRHAPAPASSCSNEQRLGGTSLNSGSVPSKALIRSATLFAGIREATRLQGSGQSEPIADLAKIAARLRRIEQRIAGYHSLARLARDGVDVHFGAAKFIDPNTIATGATRFTSGRRSWRRARPRHLRAFPGLAEGSYVTSESVFALTQFPSSSRS